MEQSTLFDDAPVREAAFRLHVPRVLQEKLDVTELSRRLPLNYQRAFFARAIASTFVYRFGLDAGFEDYRRFVQELATGRA